MTLSLSNAGGGTRQTSCSWRQKSVEKPSLKMITEARQRERTGNLQGLSLQPNIPGAIGGGPMRGQDCRAETHSLWRSRRPSVQLDAVSMLFLFLKMLNGGGPWQPYLNHCGSQFPNMLHWPHALPLQRLNSRCPQCDKDVVGTKK